MMLKSSKFQASTELLSVLSFENATDRHLSNDYKTYNVTEIIISYIYVFSADIGQCKSAILI